MQITTYKHSRADRAVNEELFKTLVKSAPEPQGLRQTKLRNSYLFKKLGLAEVNRIKAKLLKAGTIVIDQPEKGTPGVNPTFIKLVEVIHGA